MLRTESVDVRHELIMAGYHGDEQRTEPHVSRFRGERIQCLEGFSQEGLSDHGEFLLLMEFC